MPSASSTRVEASKLAGNYLDPAAGRVVFSGFAEGWLASQTFDPSTHEAVASRLRVHVLPTFGDLELRHIRPSIVQAWLRGRQERAAPRSVRVMLANLSAILGAAVEDGIISRNPCSSTAVRPPAVEDHSVVPWTADQVALVVAAHPQRWRAAPIVAAGCGLRQGEVFGLRVEDVDLVRHRLLVRQQVKLLGDHPVIAPPKGRKTREVPLPQIAAVAISEHLREHPPVDGLVFTSRERKLTSRNYYNPHIWKPALRTAASSRHAPTACTPSGTSTPACNSKRARASVRSPSTWDTPTPASRCASTPTSCRQARTGHASSRPRVQLRVHGDAYVAIAR